MTLKPTSVAAQISDALLLAIREGKYTGKTPLPSLRKLALRHGTSVSTVRAALQILLNRNEIVVYHGKGYYVKAAPAHKPRKIILILSRPGEMYEAMQEKLLQLKTMHPGIYVVVETIDQSPERLQASIEHMIADGLDTIFLNGITINRLDFIARYESAVNVYGFFHIANSLIHPSFLPGVYSDWYHGGYLGVRHLIDCGRRAILVILSSQGSIQADCRAGAARAAEDAVPPAEIEFVYDYDTELKSRYDMKSLAEHLKRGFTGIFCFTHSIAFQVYDYLKTNHYRIPQDVAVLEYYDSHLSLEFVPPLTSISLCPKDISEELLKMYISGTKQVVTVKPRLIKRASTVGN